jgi:LytS/YehU family sensor histidine kinase
MNYVQFFLSRIIWKWEGLDFGFKIINPLGLVFMLLALNGLLFLDRHLMAHLLNFKLRLGMVEIIQTHAYAFAFGLFRSLVNYLAKKYEGAESGKDEIRAKLLLTQLSPHVLINLLANIKELIFSDPASAVRGLDATIEYQRLLFEAPLGQTTLEWEKRVIKSYLSITQMRFGNIQYQIDIPKELDKCYLPALSLQPLVENAVKHGLAPRRRGGMLKVEAVPHENAILFRVSNDGVPFLSDQGSGIGIANLRDRLRRAYRDSAELSHRVEGDWTIAELRIPQMQL